MIDQDITVVYKVDKDGIVTNIVVDRREFKCVRLVTLATLPDIHKIIVDNFSRVYPTEPIIQRTWDTTYIREMIAGRISAIQKMIYLICVIDGGVTIEQLNTTTGMDALAISGGMSRLRRWIRKRDLPQLFSTANCNRGKYRFIGTDEEKRILLDYIRNELHIRDDKYEPTTIKEARA